MDTTHPTKTQQDATLAAIRAEARALARAMNRKTRLARSIVRFT